MTVEKACFSDLPEILALQKASFYYVGVQHRNFRIRPLHTALEEIEKSFAVYTYLKISINGTIVASGRAYMDGTACKIENIIVCPKHQRQGLGSRLMTEIEQQFPQAAVFELFTGKETLGNRRFYESLGYRVTGEKPADGSNPDLVYMQKQQV